MRFSTNPPGGTRPFVLLLDDLHRADPASLAALPILLVATYRTDELSPAHSLTHLPPTIVREAPGRAARPPGTGRGRVIPIRPASTVR
ncbi:MAG: ATP-binding protein [Chloroflexota bacterium]|nr:ATP-binding protein [Chloroflexota bacterium]